MPGFAHPSAPRPKAGQTGPLIARLRGERLEGIKHPAVALARSLRGEAGRQAAALYVVHGPVLLARALAAKAGVALVLYTPRLLADPAGAMVVQTLQADDVPHALVGEGVMRTVVERAYVPEVVALVERRALTPDQFTPSPTSFLLAADHLANPSNLGMLVRTAYGAGADALLLGSGSADPFVWQVSTGSTGALFRLPLVEQVQPEQLARWRASGVRMVAATIDGTLEYTEADYRQPFCLLVGNEASGLTPDVASVADLTVRIPMAHDLDSLNVAVAAGVILFEARRQRGPSPDHEWSGSNHKAR